MHTEGEVHSGDSNKTRSLNSQPGHSESAALPPGGTRDHVQCLGPRGLAGSRARGPGGGTIAEVSDTYTTQGPPLITHPSP